jgi:RNA polymerase sigma-70 factor (ECF subfamily)
MPPAMISQLARVNGQPGIISALDGHPVGVLTLDIADGRIAAIRIVVNPEKLRAIPRPPA